MESLRTAAPPTSADAGPYRPISALAVAALIVGVITALTLLGFGIAAAVTRRPFLNWFVLLMAFVALGVSIAAKVQIARSQGTRAGAKIAAAALFLSLILALGYLSYWFAMDFAIRKQSQEIAEKWMQFLVNDEPERAFRLTRDPGLQKSMSEDPDSIRRRFGSTDYGVFSRSDLPRLLHSWKNRMDMSFEGVHSWDVTPQGYKAELNFLLRFPEGLYPTRVTALGSDDPDTGNRVWQIVFQETGVRQQERQWTTLGKLIIELQHKTYQQLHDWQMKFVAAGAKAAEPLIRLEGKVPPADMRSKIAEEIVQPGALNIIPGGPTRPLGYAQLIITDNSVEITSVLEATLPSVGKELNTGLTQRVRGDALVKEMLRLAGPDWRQQPINTEQVAVLKPYQFELETVDINVRPSLPKPGPRTVTAEGPAALPPPSP